MSNIPILNKGYVRLISSSIDNKELLNICGRVYRGKQAASLLDIPYLHIELKIPLMGVLALASHNIKITQVPDKIAEFYIPSIGDIGGKDSDTAHQIINSIKTTTEALALNAKAYQMDGCPTMISQSIVPVGIYTTLIAHASLKDWINFTTEDYPSPISEISNTILNILESNWPTFKELINGKK